MKLLAWDTSSKAGAIVALESPEFNSPWERVRLAGEWSLNVDSQHSDRLLWGVHQMLESVRWRLEDVDAFAVGVGPGSFTGLRIGITTARTLAHTLQKPLIGVSSLAALARPVALWLASTGHEDATLAATTDACKGELFAIWGKARFVASCAVMPDETSSGLWAHDASEKVLAPTDLMNELIGNLKQKPDSRWLAVGEGRRRYPEAWSVLPKAQEIVLEVPFTDQVQGRFLGMVAWEAWLAQLGRSALEVHPRYVRASDAEIKLKSGVLKQAPMSYTPKTSHLPVGEKS